MKRTLCLILALCLLAALLTPAMAEEPVSSAVDAPVGEAWTAGADNGLSVDGGDTPIGDDFTAWSEDAAGFAVSAPEEDGVLVIGPDAGTAELDEFALGEAAQDVADGAAARAQANAGVVYTIPGPRTEYTFDSGLDPDELFGTFTHDMFYGSGRPVLMSSNNAGRELYGIDLTIYQALKDAIGNIAMSYRLSTIVKIPVASLTGKTSFTAAELGVAIEYDQNNRPTQESVDRFFDALWNLLKWNNDLVFDALWCDCPFEMYWMKSSYHTTLPHAQCIYDSDLDDLVAEFTEDSVTVSIPVQARYAGSDEYTLNNTVLDRVRQAIANAHAIVNYYANCSDYVKLYGYALELCRMIRYNDAAIEEGWDETEKNPWHLVWALDGDPATDVVCAGYARAFQYLCELTNFDSGVRCYIAHGDAGGSHAWNIVRMDDGRNYLVDVTWSDGAWADKLSDTMADLISNETGASLFLIGCTGSPANGYTLHYRDGRTSFRTYRDDMFSTYPGSVLTLTTDKYVLNGFQRLLGSTYYFENGCYLTGTHTIGGRSYDFGTNGALTASWTPGWHTINGRRYYFDANGLHTEHTVETIPPVPATCTEDGLTEGKRCSVCGVTLVEQDVVHAPGRHLWGAPYYTLSDDGSTMTAHRACVNDAAHQDTETTGTTSAVSLAPTCTRNGKTTYTAVFKNKVFGKRSFTREDIPALGHKWNTTYDWYSNNSCVTATRTCANDSSHREWESVYTTSVVAVEPTCTEMGQTTYTATFTNPAFTPQSKTVTDIPAKGHSWMSPTYVWSDDHATVTATQVCANDPAHIQTETVTTSSCVARYPTCTAKGTATYTARFVNRDFTTQYRDFEDIPPLGHKPVIDAALSATYYRTGLTEGSHCSRCGEILVAQQIVPVLSKTRTSLAGAKVTAANQTYTGKAIRPAVKVTLNGVALKQGTDYSVAYTNNVIGRATVTVTGMGDYTGQATGSFTIKLKKVSGLKLKAGAGKLTASWKKASGAGGYEVQYGTKSNFAGAKTVTVKSAKTVKATLKKLKSKKTYYVRVRAYRTVKKTKYVSAWSKAVKQKTK